MDPQKVIYSNLPTNGKFDIKDKLTRLLTWKALLIIVGIVVIGELLWGAYVLTRPVQGQSDKAPKVVYPMASIELETSSSNLNVGDTAKVNIWLSTGEKQTDGVDIVVNFDPNKLEVVEASGLGAVAVGSLYSEYPVNKAESGSVVLSGINNPGKTFRGRDLLGSFMVKAKASGKVSVALDFVSGSTTDSNVMETGTARDILIYTKGIEFNIN